MKKLPIGISDFKKIISEDYYYVDKSLLIQEILASGAAVTLIPRPRRFGKTLNLSMLRYFFEKVEQSNASLFKDLAIGQDAQCMARQGKYPVIFLTFKDVKQSNWENCYGKIKKLIGEEFERHIYLTDDNFLTPRKKTDFQAVIDGRADQVTYENSLKDLSSYLATFHKKRPIILMDEYDAPIHAGFFNRYYNEVINFMRGFLCSCMKDNSNLEFAIMTGILRVAKESIFSGMNNLKVSTLLGLHFSDKFGLTENEVCNLTGHYQLANSMDDIRLWFNGYNTGGGVHVYNPWSILNCIDQRGLLQPYWVNTSDNQIVKNLIKQGGIGLKQDIESLISGELVEKYIDENIIFDQIFSEGGYVWSFLLLSGYLTFEKKYLKGVQIYCTLKLPNREVVSFYENSILSWMKESYSFHNYQLMLKSLVSGDTSSFKEIFTDFVIKSFSSFDVSEKEPEKVYHDFVLGMLVSLGDEYEVKSNKESGFGRYDVMIIPKDTSQLGIVIEFKKVGKVAKETLEQAAAAALKQINDKQYVQELQTRGIKEVLKLGIAFDGKKVLIVDEDSQGARQ